MCIEVTLCVLLSFCPCITIVLGGLCGVTTLGGITFVGGGTIVAVILVLPLLLLLPVLFLIGASGALVTAIIIATLTPIIMVMMLLAAIAAAIAAVVAAIAAAVRTGQMPGMNEDLTPYFPDSPIYANQTIMSLMTNAFDLSDKLEDTLGPFTDLLPTDTLEKLRNTIEQTQQGVEGNVMDAFSIFFPDDDEENIGQSYFVSLDGGSSGEETNANIVAKTSCSINVETSNLARGVNYVVEKDTPNTQEEEQRLSNEFQESLIDILSESFNATVSDFSTNLDPLHSHGNYTSTSVYDIYFTVTKTFACIDTPLENEQTKQQTNKIIGDKSCDTTYILAKEYMTGLKNTLRYEVTKTKAGGNEEEEKANVNSFACDSVDINKDVFSE